MPATTKPTLWSALLAVQASAVKFQKDKVNPAFKGSRYASTDTILEAILPALTENELVLTQMPSSLGGDDPQPALRTRITHAPTGDYIEDTMLLMLDRSNAQGLGGAITYGRRYAVTAMLGLVEGEDDDGNAASTVEVVNRRKSSKKQSKAPEGGEDW